MSAAREEILRRIGQALIDVPTGERITSAAIDRRYQRQSSARPTEIVDLFAERVAEYRATVHRVTREALPRAIAGALNRRNVHRLAVPRDVPAEWLPHGIEVVLDEALTTEQLAAVDGVLTGCALAIALTGTIALDSGPLQGRRALTLLPDYHLCVVREEQVLATVPEAFERLHAAARHGRPITLISGPSATSDIELQRVEGVHGPRQLEAMIVA